jgi:hypothetical protein
MKIRKFNENLPENVEILENLQALTEICYALAEIFLG